MSAFLPLLLRWWKALAGAAVVAGVLLFGRRQRHAGAQERETALRAEGIARQMEATTNANEAARRVRDAAPADRERLRDKWTRPD